jgi:hypothetical protein
MRITLRVWRPIEKKNEPQNGRRYDVLKCGHAVPANDNRYRVCRSCPECAARVVLYKLKHEGRHAVR